MEDTPHGDGSGNGTEVLTRDEIKVKVPKKYAVVLHNDDYTTMEFVIEVLERFFKKSYDEAMKVMLKVHHEGRGIAGIYSNEIAETKVAQVTTYAIEHQVPLKCTQEEA